VSNRTVQDGIMHVYNRNILIIYNCKTGEFTYPNLSANGEAMSSEKRPLWQLLLEEEFALQETADIIKTRIKDIEKLEFAEAHFEDLCFKAYDGQWKWYGVGFVCPIPGEIISITFTDIHSNVVKQRRLAQMSEFDDFTGLPNRQGFEKRVILFWLMMRKASCQESMLWLALMC